MRCRGFAVTDSTGKTIMTTQSPPGNLPSSPPDQQTTDYERLLELQRVIVEQTALGEPQSTILRSLCELVEQITSDSCCSIMLLDEEAGCLRMAMAPKASKQMYVDFDGMVLGQYAGSCGTAVYLGTPVIVKDTATDPLWASMRQVAKQYGIVSCWSIPIFCDKNKAVGTFAISHPTPCMPTPFQMKLLETAGHLAGIALRRHRQDQVLSESQQHDRELAESNRRLVGEVNHRVRNNLTGLLSLLKMTRQEAMSVDEFADLMHQRITGMVKAHNLLVKAQWQNIGLHLLISRLSAGHCPSCPQIPYMRIDGPRASITPRQAVPLAMAINELFINCAKHGSHRVPEGRLEITWQHEGQHVVVDWRESNGPPITGPITPSLGMELIEGFIRFELGSEVELRFPEAGVHHTLRIAMEPVAEEQVEENV